MGKINTPQPVKLICGLIAAGNEILTNTKEYLKTIFGKIDIESDIIPFNFTSYYEKEMGTNLIRCFISFEELIIPERLAEIKLQTNQIEYEFARDKSLGLRNINIDPGYIEPSKLVLASTKNFAHRIYIGKGIYAEITLIFRKNGIEFMKWTYPDYKTDTAVNFLLSARNKLVDILRQRNRR